MQNYPLSMENCETLLWSKLPLLDLLFLLYLKPLKYEIVIDELNFL